MSYISIDEAKQKMERYCAYQERSHQQVEKKLRDMGLIPEAIDHIVLHLLREGFLNEERFAKAYVRGKFYHNKWGKKKIVQGLKRHRIHPSLIDKALSEISFEDYRQTIVELVAKKKKSLAQPNSYQARQKIYRYLYQKGFAYSEIPEDLL